MHASPLQDLELGRARTLRRADRLRRHGCLGLPRTLPAIPEPGTAARAAGGSGSCAVIQSSTPCHTPRLANASGQHRVLTVDERDFSAYRLKQGKRFDQVKWANLSRQTLPRYEPDDGPLTDEQMAAIRKLVPQGRFKPSKRLF